MKVALKLVAGTDRQNDCFWPSYNNTRPGIDHDLIVVHRDMKHIPDVKNRYGSLILENKVYLGGELPHKAFGAYREYWSRYQDKYDYFAFVSDDVVVKSDYWLSNAVRMLSSYDKLGFVGTQIFNGLLKQYPHLSHCRAPIWFGKSSAIKDIDWKFNSDHEGEMNLAEQFLAAGYFGAQVGNKIDTAYDAIDNQGHGDGDHISSLMEKKFGHELSAKYTWQEKLKLNSLLIDCLKEGKDKGSVTSSHKHIGERKIISQLQPFNGLIYDKSAEIAAPHMERCSFDINILKEYLNA